MLIIRTLFTLAAAITLTGCTAQMVSSPSTTLSSAYAPVNEASRGGVVKYLNDGAGFVIKQRREDAYKQMLSACSGKYRIDAEGQKAEGGIVMASSTSAFWAQSQYWYIQFSCIP